MFRNLWDRLTSVGSKGRKRKNRQHRRERPETHHPLVPFRLPFSPCRSGAHLCQSYHTCATGARRSAARPHAADRSIPPFDQRAGETPPAGPQSPERIAR